MAIRAQSQAEPIPGYKLLERIGGGGFGEVWKCEAPGGLLKAIKFVHGNLQGSHGDDGLMQQELKSLNRVKTVRHPYILSLERYDIIDGQLMIVMELADRNLWDRFKECEGQGLRGIPRDELLRYMDESAEALDLMNIEYQLQHLDIKPQNIFLVHNHVKVADFGLVKDLEGMNTQVTSGVTPVYAAPETFEGLITRYCDQYNLAIVYQELQTGVRPFNGTNVRQLLMQHLTGTPNLSSLPECDRGPIARALSKKPEDRFPTCTDLVRALRQAGEGGAAPAVPTRDSVSVAETPAVIRVSPTARVEKPAAVPEKKQVTATPPPAPPPPMTFPPMPEPAMTRVGPVMAPPKTLSGVLLRKELTAPQAPEEITGDGVLFPAVVIGLGRLGLNVLQQLRKNLLDRVGPPELLPHLRLLYMDSDPDTFPEATERGPDAVLEDSEVLLTRLNKPAHYLKPVRNRAALDSWLNLSMICRVPRNQTTVEGLRILGRLALVDNYRSVVSKLKADLEAAVNPKALTAAERQTRLGVRSNRPRVYVVTSLAGGTGSGMFIDVAYLVRHLLKRFGYENPEVIGLFLLPSADKAAKKSPALGNVFAALTELYHFSSPQATYQSFFDDQDEAIIDKEAPFSRCIVLPLPEEGDDPAPTSNMTMLAGDFLCRELVTPLGRKVDEARAEIATANPPEEGTFLCQTFGAYRYAMPRRVLLEQVGRALSRRVVQNWLAQDRLTTQRVVKTRLAEQWTKLELQPEALIAYLQTACERALQQAPEAQCEAIVNRVLGASAEVGPAAALGALGQLEQLVGGPTDDGSRGTPVTEAMGEATRTLRRDVEQKVGDLIASLVEDPRFRVFGAEDAVNQLAGLVGEAMRSHQTLHQELVLQSDQAHAHVHSLLVNLQKGSWWPGRKAKTAQELRDAMLQFPRTRYHALVLEQVLEVYQGLLATFPNRQEEVSFCRTRLAEFQRGLDDGTAAGRTKVDLGPGRHFLPNNCRSVEEAIDTLLKAVKPEDLLELDTKIQAMIRKQFKSLAQACLSPNTTFNELRTALLHQVETHVEGLLGKASVAAMYLKERTNDQQICADLSAGFDEAAPALAGNRQSCPELRLLTVPTDLAGERLGKLAASISKEIEVVAVSGGEDVYFYREQPQLSLADLPQVGLMAEEAYRQMTASGAFTPHTRMDVLDWLQAT